MTRTYRIQSHPADRDYRELHRVLAANVQRYLEQTGKRRRELAATAGLSPPTLTRMLAGTLNVSLRSMARLAWAMDTDTVNLLTPEIAP